MLKKYFKLNKIVILLSAILFVAINSLSICQASTANEIYNQMNTSGKKGWGTDTTPGDTGLSELVAVVIQAFLGLLGVIFLVLILYAGYNWMTAQGEEEKVTKAKDTLQRAVIGLIIIVSAYAIRSE